MIRIREIDDPELREKIQSVLAEQRGMTAGTLPDWFELDDADFVDLLNELRERESPRADEDDPRM